MTRDRVYTRVRVIQSGTPHRQQAAAVKQCVWTTSASRVLHVVQGAAKMAAALLKEGSGVLGGGFSVRPHKCWRYVSGIDTSNVDGPHCAPLGVGLGRGIYPQFQKTKLEHLPGFGRAVGACARVYVTSAAEPQ